MVSIQVWYLGILYKNFKIISINPWSQIQTVFQQFILPFLFQIHMQKCKKV